MDDAASDVIILSAPAGYGKTTLARQWLGKNGRKPVWLQVTSACLDLAVLATAAGKACATVVPGSGEALFERLRATRQDPPDPSTLAEILATDLGGWPRSSWLVLDDYHVLVESSAAEIFIECLLARSGIPSLLLTRRRPTWLTARHLLYGEAHELGANVLAMTRDEAAAVLDSDCERNVSGLLALAQGWPAIIGLAALTSRSVAEVDDLVPETLHAYFAEELYQCLPDELKPALLQLSLVPTITSDIGFELFGSDGARILSDCVEFGFLTTFGPGRFDLHPLLRRFLATKIEESRTQVSKWVERICDVLLLNRAWDDASVLLARIGHLSVLDRFLEAAMDDLLLDGRVETLRRWIADARDHTYSSPSIDLAEAELLFREGKPQRAEELALAAAEKLSPDHAFQARALNRAAHSAHFDNRTEDALHLHTRAASVAKTVEERRKAIWGQFITQAELERRDEAAATIGLLEEIEPCSVEDRIRLAQAHLTWATRFGGTRQALRRWRHFSLLMDSKCDPLIRTGFLHTLGHVQILAAAYEEALAIAQRQEGEATRLGLDFVLPHAWYLRAAAQIGLREFSAARRTLRRASQKAGELGDHHSCTNYRVLEAKVLLAESLASKAAEILDVELEDGLSSGMVGEVLAMHALAAACHGDLYGAERLRRDSAERSDQIEATLPRLWTEAIVMHQTTRDEACMRLAFEASVESGHLDSIVYAYRSYRPVLTALANVTAYRSQVKGLLHASRDYGLARRSHLVVVPPSATAREALTDREREVITLIRNGLSNAEIARALWIEESTAKVHVRHILRKLGVRTRTEAAVLAEGLDLADRPAADA